MTFVSTRDPRGRRYGLGEALRLGPAPDGGLFVPERLEPLADDVWRRLHDLSLPEIGDIVLTALLGDTVGEADGAEIDRATLRRLAAEALDFPIPLRRLGPRHGLLELFHGPTLAFKDVGARFLARLLAATRGGDEGIETDATTVLVATSGDTGGAVAQAFFGVDGVEVVILYPHGKVSPLQERQLATLGGNVRAFAVDGAFDDCQSLVRQAFTDRELATRLGLTSANSINVGRLLPQAIYYVHAAAQLTPGETPLFVVPSGNFGNLTAGLFARRLGLDARFVAATNINDVVPEYLASGLYEPRPSVRTISNAMDVGAPSNFERIRWLYDDDLDALRADVSGFRADDDQTRDTIAAVAAEHGEVLDPHTAVGWLALEDRFAREAPAEGTVGVVLATAHASKFGETVEPVLGRPIEIPRRLARHLEKPLRSERLDPSLDALRLALGA
ncbi:MAG: threonine synthase [Acidobacteriota bacterium]